jgi:hypothetical protein
MRSASCLLLQLTAQVRAPFVSRPPTQYSDANGASSKELLADLQSLGLKQAKGFDIAAQECLSAALPLRRTMQMGEPYVDPGLRLSGQCWLSYKRGHALRMWI